jgi:hypothetical protein
MKTGENRGHMKTGVHENRGHMKTGVRSFIITSPSSENSQFHSAEPNDPAGRRPEKQRKTASKPSTRSSLVNYAADRGVVQPKVFGELRHGVAAAGLAGLNGRS